MQRDLIVKTFIKNNPQLDSCLESIINAEELLKTTFYNNKKLLVCGNGGSASDSMHIVGELQKGFLLPRDLTESEKNSLAGFEDSEFLQLHLQRGLPAISLVSEISLSTAIMNDNGADLCFAQQVWSMGNRDDALLCISTSGNSRNVVLAAQVAKAKQMKVISLIGNNKNAKLCCLSDIVISTPAKDTYRIQEMHLPIYHLICTLLESEFYSV